MHVKIFDLAKGNESNICRQFVYFSVITIDLPNTYLFCIRSVGATAS